MAAATLETLPGELKAAAEMSAPRTGWANLDRDEQAQLELLVERVVGLGFFARRRGKEAAALTVELLAASAERPSPLQFLAPRGATVLPVGVLDDLASGRLIDLDVAVLAAYALTFASRRIDPRVERDVSWADDGATLVIARGLHRLLPSWDHEVAPGTDSVGYERDEIRARLEANGWLTVEQAERDPMRPDRDRLRVRLGPRFTGQARARRRRMSGHAGERS